MHIACHDINTRFHYCTVLNMKDSNFKKGHLAYMNVHKCAKTTTKVMNQCTAGNKEKFRENPMCSLTKICSLLYEADAINYP